jgi:hypothetical protein
VVAVDHPHSGGNFGVFDRPFVLRIPGMNARARFALICLALMASLAIGCSSGMGRDQCANADWQMIGFEDGLRGMPAERISVHRVACAKHQVTPDLAAYLAGRDKGLVEYCQPKNGFRVGLHGVGYANVCSGPAEPNFVSSYRYGRQIYDARSELRQAQGRLRAAREDLAQTDTAMSSVSAELILPKVAVDRRAFLATELVRLAQARTEIVANIDYLTQRTQQLAVSVQDLERQSPYPI